MRKFLNTSCTLFSESENKLGLNDYISQFSYSASIYQIELHYPFFSKKYSLSSKKNHFALLFVSLCCIIIFLLF